MPVDRLTMTPDEMALALYAVLLVEDLKGKGYVDGGEFRVDVEQAYATLKMLVAVDKVAKPDHALACAKAMDFMLARGGIVAADRPMMGRLLLQEAQVEWPA